MNDHKGSTILKIKQDSIGTVDAYDVYIKDTLGDYSEITLRPDIAKLFKIGDVI